MQPRNTYAAAEMRDTLAHVAACRAKIMGADSPEHPTHHGAISLSACGALDAIAAAVTALHDRLADLAEFGEHDAAEGIAAQLHDMASDVTGTARKRMAQPAWSHNDERNAA